MSLAGSCLGHILPLSMKIVVLLDWAVQYLKTNVDFFVVVALLRMGNFSEI